MCGSLDMVGGRSPPTIVFEGLWCVSSIMIFMGTENTKIFPLKETQTLILEAVREQHRQDYGLNQITEGQPRGRAAESCVEAVGWE